jgi:hypothetical protein
MTIAEGFASSDFEMYRSKIPATELGSSDCACGKTMAGSSNAAHSTALILLEDFKINYQR